MSSIEEIAGKFLGKKVEGKSQYDPSFLVAVPRQENRTYLGIGPDNIPNGFDTWYGYEFTALTYNGVPINRVIKIIYPSSSPFIVESKSLKLYLNSFAMTKLGNRVEAVLDKAKEIIVKDLSEKLQTTVKVGFLDEKSPRNTDLFSQYENLYDLVDLDKLTVNVYNEDKSLLSIKEIFEEPREYNFSFHSLRSNCRVTHQPDYGDIFIHIRSRKHISEESLVKYLCSFRNEFHFHEEICEACFTRLSKILDEEDTLVVTALYTRRGGIDINPCRYQNVFVEFSDTAALADPEVFTRSATNIKQ